MTTTSNTESETVLVLGATGYIGGRLIPLLLSEGYAVRCLARTPEKLDSRPWVGEIEIFEGDVLEPATLDDAFAGADRVYYLIHSLGAGDDFEDIEKRSASHVREAAERAAVKQIVYLGGLGREDDDLSPHLRSRQEVGRELAAGPVPVTELRAAIILGSGSASFEMLRGLVEVLPVMVTPAWVQRTRCQPIAVRDVLARLIAVLGRDDLEGIWEVGGPDVVTYGEMMQAYARAAGIGRRIIIPVPVLSPSLSAHWVDVVTSLPGDLAGELVESLQNDVIVDGRALDDVIPLGALDLEEALDAALAAIQELNVPTRWSPASPVGPARPEPWDPDWAGGTVMRDERTITIEAAPEAVMRHVRAIGGDEGWLGYSLLWDLRGIGDVLVGGVGSRRGRRHPTDLAVGDVVDLFRVEESTATSLRLRAEMKMPGFGWLEWRAEPVDGSTELTQIAQFLPKGLLGRAYWYLLVPFHELVFRRMLDELRSRSEDFREDDQNRATGASSTSI